MEVLADGVVHLQPCLLGELVTKLKLDTPRSISVWQQFITYPVVNSTAVCTPMDGHSSLLLFANIKERLVSGYVAAIIIAIVYMHGLLLS